MMADVNNQKISLIIPVYNMEQFLPLLFKCVKAQVYKNFEVIFVDDGSKDNSGKLLDDFEFQCKQENTFFDCVVIHKENGGLSSARNRGIEESKGEYLVFADSDDTFSPLYLEGLMFALQNGKNDIGCVSYKYTNKSKICKKKGSLSPKKLHQEENSIGFSSLVELVCKNTGIANFPSPSYAWNKIYKRSLIGDLRFIPFLAAEDVRFNYCYLQRCKKIGYLNEELYYYLQRPGSLSRNMDKYNKHLSKIISEYNEILSISNEYSSDFTKSASYFFACLTLFYVVFLHFHLQKVDKELKTEFKEFFDSNKKYFFSKTYKFKIWYWGIIKFLYRILKFF